MIWKLQLKKQNKKCLPNDGLIDQLTNWPTLKVHLWGRTSYHFSSEASASCDSSLSRPARFTVGNLCPTLAPNSTESQYTKYLASDSFKESGWLFMRVMEAGLQFESLDSILALSAAACRLLSDSTVLRGSLNSNSSCITSNSSLGWVRMN